jgi:AcrR family transcriptional regulator
VAVVTEDPVVATGTRQERKERTRQAILDAALTLSEDTGLAGLSLRAVAKEVGIVPTAFYRHFASIEELGLALVDASFASLRTMMREARRSWVSIDAVIESSVEILARNVRDRRAYFLFMFRERMSGIVSVREAIRHELELFERELATDLARLPGPDRWSTEDLRVFANLIVGLMVNTTEAILTAPRPEAERAVVATAEKQIRFLVIGAASWEGQDEVSADL